MSLSGQRQALCRRTIRVLLVSQILAGAGLAAGITVGALLAEDMLGSTGSAGLPAALFTLGAAAAAVIVGRLSERAGRRRGLSLGYAIGALGGAGVVAASVIGSAPLFFLSLFLYGAGSATNLQARYAGADLVEANRRGRAVSTVLVATTAGAVLGPNLIGVMGSVAAKLGIPGLAGPFLLASLAYGLASVVLLALLRPDPLLTARAWAAAKSDGFAPKQARVSGKGGSLRLVWIAATAMVLTQVVMVAVMTMTPIHMRANSLGLAATGLVISIHIAAMYLPSPLTGILVDRLGRRRIIAAGAATLLSAGLLVAVSPPESVPLLAVALGLLGLGWNFGLIAGTAWVTDVVPLAGRARTQGVVDAAVSLAGATGGVTSGIIVTGTSYAALSLMGGLLALVILPLLLAGRQALYRSKPDVS